MRVTRYGLRCLVIAIDFENCQPSDRLALTKSLCAVEFHDIVN